MTGRAYMREVLNQVWLKSIKKYVSELRIGQTSECTKREKLLRFMQAPASPRKGVR